MFSQGDDLHGLAGTGGLFDQNISGRPADVGDQAHLIGPQLFCRRIHTSSLKSSGRLYK